MSERKVHPLCVAKALKVADELREYFDEYVYHKRLYAIPSEYELDRLASDLEYLVNSCIPVEEAKERFKDALQMVRAAKEYRERKMYDDMMRSLKQAYAQFSLGTSILSQKVY